MTICLIAWLAGEMQARTHRIHQARGAHNNTTLRVFCLSLARQSLIQDYRVVLMQALPFRARNIRAIKSGEMAAVSFRTWVGAVGSAQARCDVWVNVNVNVDESLLSHARADRQRPPQVSDAYCMPACNTFIRGMLTYII